MVGSAVVHRLFSEVVAATFVKNIKKRLPIRLRALEVGYTSGKFFRSVRLPMAETQQASANHEDGDNSHHRHCNHVSHNVHCLERIRTRAVRVRACNTAHRPI